MKKFLILVIVLFVGCTDATVSQFTSYGSSHTIQLWSGGKMVQEWKSTGKVISEESSDGYYFRDADTKELVRVTGDLVITSK